ncbi:predicted protein [Histoplasma mississippiense (nom. inval.)]|uniref:predicted protein n=2 Tax=Ajellomyces capsulatus (strain NAm1 / WU24) TaxID=2059318 RepID=UPI000157B49F|nr:predicted protein [Histoplasma mississippiense (nom. inval.)]XP_001541429.1 predicted protein [Histoplasma mississippiense (nom. inval.)]XP_001542273.1 predicted protein [Histoplasma mississippiense (nom. inval.)]XP_001543846.1 predicted protein [Histoplasma mississippiense (nom. inval.)]EDN03028.1 predicted protein [Histoplasma mississippiense (nom. inval.)]EDN05841.1 predicted protein [Histoplasma mississippiense (nom. inval.)]EDN06996.1 predicted protein [Histoplasma mississippiense (no
MPPQLSEFTTNEIVRLLNDGYMPAQIARTIECSLATVYRIQRNIRCFGTARSPRSTWGVKPKITPDILSGLEDFFEAYPTAYRDEAVCFVKDEFDVDIHPRSISRLLKKLNLTWKKMRVLRMNVLQIDDMDGQAEDSLVALEGPVNDLADGQSYLQ